jgi:hypothetical protein
VQVAIAEPWSNGPVNRLKLIKLSTGVQLGVWRTLDAAASPGADQPRFGQIELGPTVHLPLHQLEAGDLPLGLAV